MQTDAPQLSNEPFILPASYAQQRMWFLDRLEGGAVYNVPIANRLRGPLDLAALRRALDALIERHETLRTSFALVDGVPQQVIAARRPVALEVIDLSDAPAAERDALRIAGERATASFDLSADQLVRATVIRISTQDHVLSLVLHHIVTDAWSMRVLGRELAELYDASLNAREAQLPELCIQYGDYAVWQQEWLEMGGLEDQIAYWKRHLAGAPAVLELPTDRPRPAEQSFRGRTLRTVLPRDLLERLHGVGQRAGTTPFMTLLAAFATLLARYSRQDDVVVATPVANRGRVELENLIGLFVNTLAMRVDLAGDPTFLEVLARVRETALGAFANQDVPFEKLVQELAPERSRAHAPVAQVMFVLQNASEEPAGLAGTRQERILTDRGTSKFDLTLFASELPSGLRVAVEYAVDLFEEATIQRLLGHFETLLQAIVADPQRPLSELPMVGEAELRTVVDTFADGGPAAPGAQVCVHELVARQAARTPEAVAVTAGTEALTYGELDARANQLAHFLGRHGVGPGAVVALAAERSVELVVAVLGTLKAGAAYAPVDPEYPPARIAFMLADAAAPVLLTQAHLLPRLPDFPGVTVCLDRDWEAIASAPRTPPSSDVQAEDLGYVLYTSGSTGEPKGVAMPHRAMSNLIASQLGDATGPAAACTLQFASLSFDVAFQEIFSTWCSGATLVLVDSDTRRDPAALIRHLNAHGVERLFLPFVALEGLCEEAQERGLTVSTLREVITAGEQLKATTHVRGFFERHAGCRLINQYGPTETHVVTSHACEEAPASWPALPPIGRPIAGARVYVLDAHLRPAPIGVPGELYIAGASVAQGYLGRPDLTEERFLADPFAAPGTRMYRTGDLGRWLASGEIEFLGRADDQVKVRGFRVELGEVEAALAAHPGVAQAVVTLLSDRLVGYVVARDGEAIEHVDLLSHARRVLPAYMVPGQIVTMQALPLTPSGKVNRRALPAPEAPGESGGRPASELERAVAAIWEELLEVRFIGRDDDFFALGGHSLLAVKMIARLRALNGIDVPLQLIFETSSLAPFAAAVQELSADRQPGHAPPLRAARRRILAASDGGADVYAVPASYAERRFWLLHQLETHTAAYHIVRPARLRGRLDVAALERALSHLSARHESLRASFAVIDSDLHRVVRPSRSVRLPVLDVSRHHDADPEQRAHQLLLEEATHGFDLETGPLMRTALIRIGPEEHVLVLVFHHIIVDAWSMGLLARELNELYRAYTTEAEVELDALPLQYGDYAAWQQEWMNSGGLEEQLGYWRRELAGAPALLGLPLDHPRPAAQSLRGAVVTRTLEVDLMARVRALADREGATMFMTLLSAFMALLHRHAQQDDIVVAAPIVDRSHVELEGVVGCFLNTLALRGRFATDPSFVDLVRQVRRTTLGAFAHRDLPFEKLVEDIAPERSLSYPPIAQVMFVLEADGPPGLKLEGLDTTPAGFVGRSAKFEISMFAREASDGLRLSLEYCSDLFERESMERLLDRFGVLLEGIVADGYRPVGELPILEGEERRRLLVEWNDTRAPYPAVSLPELIDEQAARAPDRVAVQFADRQLTYGELVAQANQLAHHLQEQGVGLGDAVGICLQRSPDMVVGVLGIMKAGAAYVPVDPEFPALRRRFMLENSGARAMVTESALAADVPVAGLAVVCLDADRPQIGRCSTQPPSVTVGPEDLAHVIYTSGSTGQPKGVEIPHRALVNLLVSLRDEPGCHRDDVVLAIATLSFDIAGLELFLPLITGARVVIASREEAKDPEALARLLEASGTTFLQGTPTTWRMLVESGWPGIRGLKALSGGEALSGKLADALLERGLELWNLYGPTETTIYSTGNQLTTPGRPPTIGPPIANTRIYVLDKRLQPVPVGVAGELWIGGDGLARGYRGAPELTAERFRPDPFVSGEGAVMYRSGDIGRYRSDRSLECLGRVDHQVKLRGYRIELGEIEALLRRHPAVLEAVAIVRRLPDGERQLVAYVTARDEPPVVSTLREFLERALPDYMIPAAFVTLPSLPLTLNGKLNRAALPAPGDQSRASAQYRPATSELEQALISIWEALLDVPRVGVNDNFFSLGGHSLLAARMVNEVRESLGLACSLAMVFEARTVRELAQRLEKAGHAGETLSSDPRLPVVLPMHRDGDGPRVFCLSGVAGFQELAKALGPEVPLYGAFIPIEQELVNSRGEGFEYLLGLTVEELASAYIEAIRRHQPEGPYVLLGHCFAGIVAYEMSQQLAAAGQEVALLALLDVWLPDAVTTGRWHRSLRRMRLTGDAALQRVDQFKLRVGLSPSLSREILRLERLRGKIYASAMKHYELRPFDGQVLLLQASGTASHYGRRIADRTWGWAPYVERLHMASVPGTHMSSLRPPAVHELAETLKFYLAGVRASRHAEPAPDTPARTW